MRINVYSQELTTDVAIVAKSGINETGEPEQFYGVRLYLLSPEQLHHTIIDDDRSAITLWLPKSSHRRQDLANAFYEMAQLIERNIT